MLPSHDQASRECPDCGARLPVIHGYRTWCDACGWNLSPVELAAPRSRVDAAYAAVGRRLGDRLALELIAAERLEPRLTPAKAAAYAIAVAVHLATLGLIAGGVALAVLAFPNLAAIVVGIVMVGAGYLMRPRLGKPPEQGVVDRARAPELHRLVDEVAQALETQTVDVLVVDHRFNASWAIVGGRKRVLRLGLPLLEALEPGEQVALIAHELAHGRNGDAARGQVVGTALDGLGELYGVLAPGWGGSIRYSELAGLEPVVNGLLWLLSRPALGLFQVELHLLLRDSQRAEYLADALAAGVAGTDATIGMHEKLLLLGVAAGIVRKSVHARPATGELLGELRSAMRSVPERERERRRRVARLEASRLDATHPPTASRIRLLEERPRREPVVELDPDRAAAVAHELGRLSGPIEQRLLEDARAALYR